MNVVRSGLLIWLCLTAWPASAAVTAEAYLAERDKAIAALRLPDGQEPTAADSAREKAALAKLQVMLREVIGPIQLRGFVGPGSIALDTLREGFIGFERVDGLSIKFTDGGTRGIVTTEPLLRAWLRTSGRWQGPTGGRPVEPDAVFADGSFLTSAIGNDAALQPYAEIPAGLSLGRGSARVMLIRAGQDFTAPNPPDELIAIVSAGLIVIARERVSTPIGQIPACKSAFDRDTAAADAIYKKYEASDARDEALLQRYETMQANADKQFKRCFGAAIQTRPEYGALLKQAASLAERASPR